MWVIRAIVGLVFLAAAVFTVPMWFFNSPGWVVLTMFFAVIGLWVMGYVSRFASPKVLAEDARREREIRRSRFFGLRNRIMGSVAALMGATAVVIALRYESPINAKALLGGIVMLALGLWYIVKGRAAE